MNICYAIRRKSDLMYFNHVAGKWNTLSTECLYDDLFDANFAMEHDIGGIYANEIELAKFELMECLAKAQILESAHKIWSAVNQDTKIMFTRAERVIVPIYRKKELVDFSVEIERALIKADMILNPSRYTTDEILAMTDFDQIKLDLETHFGDWHGVEACGYSERGNILAIRLEDTSESIT